MMIKNFENVSLLNPRNCLRQFVMINQNKLGAGWIDDIRFK